MKPFVVGIADLVHRPAKRRHEKISAATAELRVAETIASEGSHMVIDTVLEAASDGVVVAGSATVEWTAICRRCLEPIAGSTAAEFREMYSHAPVEGDTYPITNETVDLELVGREAILLELPLAPLCRDDCAGLCPTCGANRNEGECDCPPAVTDHRWSGLAGMNFGPADEPNLN